MSNITPHWRLYSASVRLRSLASTGRTANASRDKKKKVGWFFFTVPVRPRFAALATLNKLKDVELLLPSFRGHQEQPLHQKLLIINSKPFSRGRGRVLSKKISQPCQLGIAAAAVHCQSSILSLFFKLRGLGSGVENSSEGQSYKKMRNGFGTCSP